MKRGRFLKIMLSLAIAVVMCIGMATTALAAGAPITGTEMNPAEAAITKRLDMPTGVTTPTANFTFTIAPKSFNGSTDSTNLARIPAIASKTISFSGADTTDIVTSDTLKSVAKQANMFTGITFATAGIYSYTVKETSNTYSAASNEKMTYSSAEYEVTAYVANKASTGTYIKAIAAKIVVKDNDGQTVGDKVDPTPTSTITGTSNAMVFTNTYVKSKPGDPDTPDPNDPTTYATKITKTVTGDFGDKTAKFTFTVTVNKPSIAAADSNTFKGFVYSATGTKGSAITFTYGTGKTVELAHGEFLILSDAYTGSTYTVSETAVNGYTPSYVAVVGGVTNTSVSSATTTALDIKEAENRVDYTNKYMDITPTGIIMNNLPYVMLIVVALGAFVAFLIVKSRKKKATENR